MAYTLGNKCAKIFVNGQFHFNLSSKTWSHVFLEHSVYALLMSSQRYDLLVERELPYGPYLSVQTA